MTLRVAGLCVLLFLIPGYICSQDYPYDIPQYDFIKYDENKLEGDLSQLPGFDKFFKKWQELILNGDSKIEILHLGDSHIQADFFTGQVRQRMQRFFPGSEGARGVVFPYNLAATNNPGNYLIRSSNKWKVVNGVKQENVHTGLIPAKVYSTDSVIDLSINQYDTLPFSGFNEIEMWYASKDKVILETPSGNCIDVLPGQGKLNIALRHLVKKVEIKILGADSLHPFELYGIGLKNELPGITYHALGLNGAQAEDFAQCENFESFLNFTNPDLIVISLGTNDIYDRYAKMSDFTLYYGSLIQQIRAVFPDKALILTTPGDHFIRGYLPNKKVKKAATVIQDLAVKFQSAVWDFYAIMGGEGSMRMWDMYGLSARDRVHLSKKGYHLQGDLFFNALLHSFEHAAMPEK